MRIIDGHEPQRTWAVLPHGNNHLAGPGAAEEQDQGAGAVVAVQCQYVPIKLVCPVAEIHAFVIPANGVHAVRAILCQGEDGRIVLAASCQPQQPAAGDLSDGRGRLLWP